jgi:hypothetical protein
VRPQVEVKQADGKKRKKKEKKKGKNVGSVVMSEPLCLNHI